MARGNPRVFTSAGRSGKVVHAVGFSVAHMKEITNQNRFGQYRVRSLTRNSRRGR